MSELGPNAGCDFAQPDQGTRSVLTSARLSVAPMMDWTDRHCRYFHRLISQQALLYTEMVTAPALVRGGALHLLDHSTVEHPVALQLGGSDPRELRAATMLGVEAGYHEVNLNCGCPSDRVQSGTFGAVLMKDAPRVAECCAEMAGQGAEITVKCRIGVDDQTPADVLPDFIARIADAGVKRVTIHARMAWLQGLSPKDNRTIPPLDYPLVHAMKAQFPDLHISINGGIDSIDMAAEHLDQGLDGVMIGRAAYHTPYDILAPVDERLFSGTPAPERFDIALAMRPYVEAHLDAGGRLHQIMRHMLGLFSGRPGARGWRQVLSSKATRDGAGWEVVEEALDRVAP